MRVSVLDASALLRFLDAEPGSDYVERLLLQCAAGEATLLMAAVNWGECISAIVRYKGMDAASDLINKLSSLRITVIPIDASAAEDAAFFKQRFKIPYADAFAGSLALRETATLVTADFDFKSLPAGVLRIEFLPLKPMKA